MTRRERLMAALRGEATDRPAVNFYEIGGFEVDPSDPDEFNVYNSSSWQPLLQLTEECTDIIRMRSAILKPTPGNRRHEFFATEQYTRGKSRFTRTTLRVAGRTMTSLTRRDPNVDTVWTLEHLIKDTADVKAYLELQDEVFACEPDVSNLVAADEKLGDRGIVMVETGDPLGETASLFSMQDYLIFATTEQDLFHGLLDKHAQSLYARTEKIAKAFPGHLWRICGAEYATEPFLPPRLFEQYVVRYTKPMVEIIHKYGGYARIHCHGRLRTALPMIAAMSPTGIDPVEPPPQGDIELAEVRREYGKDLVLFGNIELSDIVNIPPADFEKSVAKSLCDGTAGEGRGSVLMPTASPYGREITPTAMKNYETMVNLATNYSG